MQVRCHAISIDTKIAFAFYDLGLAYERMNRLDLAAENFRKSLSYDASLSVVKGKLDSFRSVKK
jgi:Tfp pilus assembly protein PilF